MGMIVDVYGSLTDQSRMRERNTTPQIYIDEVPGVDVWDGFMPRFKFVDGPSVHGHGHNVILEPENSYPMQYYASGLAGYTIDSRFIQTARQYLTDKRAGLCFVPIHATRDLYGCELDNDSASSSGYSDYRITYLTAGYGSLTTTEKIYRARSRKDAEQAFLYDTRTAQSDYIRLDAEVSELLDRRAAHVAALRKQAEARTAKIEELTAQRDAAERLDEIAHIQGQIDAIKNS